jgi:formimidoylglutamate deiminase
MAASGAIAGLCLTTEANLGDGIFPTRDFLDVRGRFGIGSDSHIAVDWRSELRLLEYGQRLLRRERNVLASGSKAHVADRLFDAATIGGAAATGRAVGVLEAGRRADWIVLDPEHSAIAGHTPDAWLSGVVFCEHGETPVLDVGVGGKRVVEARRHRDEAIAFQSYRETLKGLLG